MYPGRLLQGALFHAWLGSFWKAVSKNDFVRLV